jgi:hypothetical protein
MLFLPLLERFGVMLVFGAHYGLNFWFSICLIYWYFFFLFLLHLVKPLPNLEGKWLLAFRFVFPYLVFWLHIESLHQN